MATITVRIPDDIRDALQGKADYERQTLSDFVRQRLEEAVYPSREREGQNAELTIKSLDPMQRHTLALLHRILGRVLPADSSDADGDIDYQLERAQVLEKGFTSEYWVELAGLQPELTTQQCEFVMDVLDMFRIALYSMDHLRESGSEVTEELRRSLTFGGFDHNDSLESQMSAYVTYLVRQDKWAEQADFVLGRERGNSHHRNVDVYSRMLAAYREVKGHHAPTSGPAGYFLTMEQLEEVAAARVHPSNR